MTHNPAHTVPSNLTPREYTYREAFGPEFPDQWTLPGFEDSDFPFVPEPDPKWRWERSVLFDLSVWWQYGRPDGLLLHGPTGSGKSGAVRQFCAALRIPLYSKTFHERVEFDDLVSKVSVVGGNTLASYQHLALAMGAEGWPGIFCANELDFADPNMLSGLHDVLDGQPLLVDVGGLEPVVPHPQFGVIATCNTALNGDSTGQYVGTRVQNAALGDRWVRVKVGYLKEAQEQELLASVVAELPQDQRHAMVEVANLIRRQHLGESSAADALPFTMSTRTLQRWARWTFCCRAGNDPVYYALDRALGSGLSPVAHLALTKVVEGKFGQPKGSHG